MYWLQYKERKVPLFESEGRKALFRTLRYFDQMVQTYQFLRPNQVLIGLPYELFSCTVRGVTKDTWNDILEDPNIFMVGAR